MPLLTALRARLARRCVQRRTTRDERLARHAATGDRPYERQGSLDKPPYLPGGGGGG
jgi:hypothetical protein